MRSVARFANSLCQIRMKKLLFIVLTFVALGVYAQQYSVVVGTAHYPASPAGSQDFQGRDQFVATCVPVNAGEVVTCYNETAGVGWAITAIDQYGEYQKFNCAADGLHCLSAGTYDFYIKLKYEDDLWYVGPAAEGCGSTPVDTTDVPSDYAGAVPPMCHDVMLQAFYWDSNQSGKLHGDTRWKTLQEQAAEMAAYFDLVWCPPSAKSSGGVGYHPSQYSNQNSDWGTRDDLQKFIATLHEGGSKVVADIVVNHVNNKSGWCDFYDLDFGEFGQFSPTPDWICNTDEMNSDPNAGSCRGRATGNADDGYGAEANYGAARDWDHNNAQVREMCRAYLKWLRKEIGYDGFRYDYCKGFHNSHIADYNNAAEAYFSVMEYWDGNPAVLQSRLADAHWNTLTFDFGTKYQAFNNGIAAGNYSGCRGSGLLGAGKSKYAVTFIDSHDSYQRDDNEFCGKGNSMKASNRDHLLEANAFMLSMPGVPCVFYPHWKELKAALAPMIVARHQVGVHSESAVSDEGDASGYRATVTGTNGTLVLELGNRVSITKSGYQKACSGNGYAIWTRLTAAVAPRLVITPSTTFKTDSMIVELSAVGGSEEATVYFTTDGSDPRTSDTRQTYSSPISISGTTTFMAYAQGANSEGEVYTRIYTYKAPQTTPLIVSFYKPASWAKVNLYSWTSAGELTGKWPGTELTARNADGYYYYQFDPAVTEVNFIFNNGSEQTADLFTDEDVCYTWTGGAAQKTDCSKPLDLEAVKVEKKAAEIVLKEGRLFIRQGENVYTITGMQVR